MVETKCHAKMPASDIAKMNSLSQNSWDVNGCCKKLSDKTDHESCHGSVSQLHTEAGKAWCASFEKQGIESLHSRLNNASLLLENERARYAIGLNKPSPLAATEKASCLSEACGSANVLLDNTTKSDSLPVFLQPTIQSIPATSTDQIETESISQSITRTDVMSVGEQSSPACPSVGADAQVTGHTDSRSSGARPKLVPVKKSSKSRNSKKNVRWCEETTSIPNIDARTYEQYRKYLSDYSIPNTVVRNAATEAVLFMSDKDENNHITVIDMALKFLWARDGCCPNAKKLYSAMCDFKYDEKNIVLAFLEMYQSEREKSGAIAEQQFSPPHTEEPLKALDFQIQSQVSQVQTTFCDFQLQDEARHQISENNNASPLKGNEMPEKQHKNLLTEKELKHVQLQVLQREQEHLKASMMCVLCRKKQIEVTLLPCGHFVLCATCSEHCHVCPVCNKEALAEVKTFLC